MRQTDLRGEVLPSYVVPCVGDYNRCGCHAGVSCGLNRIAGKAVAMNQFETEGPTLSEVAVFLALVVGVVMLWYAAC
jgi:hypothetical protein